MYFEESARLHGQSNPPSWRSLGLLMTPASSSPVSESCDSDFQSSAASVASSQTSYSTDTQWPSVELDVVPPSGKPTLPALSTDFATAPPHPRRANRAFQPPSLVRQHERKGQFVYHLVDSATLMVETIWPTSAPACHAGAPQGHQSMLPLRTFIEETLRRSKTSFSTLQVALFYLISLKSHVPLFDFTMEQPNDSPLTRALQCGRRMFLAALILGSKYLQDRNYSARAWSKISGLQVSEINLNERAFLAAVKWELHIPEKIFNKWQDILIKYSQPAMIDKWRFAIPHLCPKKIATSMPETPPYSPQELFKSVPWSRSQTQPNTPIEAFSRNSLIASPLPVASPTLMELRSSMQPPAAPSPMKLATPQISTACPTPAVSSASEMLRHASRPRSMCFAINTASTMATARSCVDFAPATSSSMMGASGRFSRRSSLASTAGSASTIDSASPSATSSPRSSPGSMVSDHSSRSSSVCSIPPCFTQNTSPVRNPLSRLATMNAAYKMVDYSSAAVATPSCDDSLTVLGSGPLTSGQMTSSPEVIVIEDEPTPTQISYDVVRESRKRHRTSVDFAASKSESGLQDQVRMLMRREFASRTVSGGDKDANRRAAKKHRLVREASGCEDMIRPTGGPGMWEGILV